MGMILGNGEFSKYKKKTARAVQIPGNVRETLPVNKIWEDGIFEIEHGDGVRMFDRIYQMGDINYTLKDEKEKESVLLTLCKIFNSITTDFKILIVNAGRDMGQFCREIFYPEEGTYGKLGKGNNDWIREGLKKGNPEISQTRYLVLTVRKKSYEEAKAYFVGHEAVLSPLFEAVKSSITPLDAQKRLRMLAGIYRKGKEPSPDWETLTRFGRNWRNEVLPSYLDSKKEYLMMDGRYISVLFAFALPNSLDEGKVMAELGNLPFPSMVTLDHAPIPRAVVRNKLMAAARNNERAIHMEQERRMKAKNFVSGISYEKQKKKEEIEGYLEQLDDNDENGYFFSLLVTVMADTKEELLNRMESIRFIGEGLGGIQFVPYRHRQLKAFHTALPIGAREVDCMRCMLTSSLAAFQPFYSKDLIQPGGQYYGVNRVTRNLILLDRKKLKNGNGIILGHTGSGKSMLLKAVEIVQPMIGSRDDIFAIDPQNELKGLAEVLGGQFFDLSAQSKIHLNFLEIPEEVWYSTDVVQKDMFVAEQVSFAEAFCYSIMKGMSPNGIHKSIITGCIMKLYQEVFSGRKLRQPVLTDFYHLLTVYGTENPGDEKEVREIYKPLEAYCFGTFDLFAKRSNLDIRNRFVAFGMKNISEEMWEPVMLVVMHLLSQRINYNQKYQRATRFIVDEGQIVCRKESSAEQLNRAFLTYRKFGGICTLILQNMSAALANPVVKDLLSNCEFKCFFDQGGVDRQEVADILELSFAESEALNEEVPGQCVIVCGKDVLLCDSRILRSSPLFELYQTSFHRDEKK